MLFLKMQPMGAETTLVSIGCTSKRRWCSPVQPRPTLETQNSSMSRRASPSSCMMMAIFLAIWLVFQGRCATILSSATKDEGDLCVQVERQLLYCKGIISSNWRAANASFLEDADRQAQELAQGAIIQATWDAYKCLTDHLPQICLNYPLNEVDKILKLGASMAQIKLKHAPPSCTLHSCHHLDYYTKYLRAFNGLAGCRKEFRKYDAPLVPLSSPYQLQEYLQLRVRLYELELFSFPFNLLKEPLDSSRRKEDSPEAQRVQNSAWEVLLDSFLDNSYALFAGVDALIRSAPAISMEIYQLFHAILFDQSPSQLILALQGLSVAPQNSPVPKVAGALSDSTTQLLSECTKFFLHCDIYRAKVLAPILLKKLQRGSDLAESTRPTLGSHDGRFIPDYFGLRHHYSNDSELLDLFISSVEFPNDAAAFVVFQDDLRDRVRASQCVAEATFILEMERILVETVKIAARDDPAMACRMHSQCFHLLILADLIRANPTHLQKAAPPSYAPQHKFALYYRPHEQQQQQQLREGELSPEYLKMPSRPAPFSTK